MKSPCESEVKTLPQYKERIEPQLRVI